MQVFISHFSSGFNLYYDIVERWLIAHLNDLMAFRNRAGVIIKAQQSTWPGCSAAACVSTECIAESDQSKSTRSEKPVGARCVQLRCEKQTAYVGQPKQKEAFPALPHSSQVLQLPFNSAPHVAGLLCHRRAPVFSCSPALALLRPFYF